MATTRINFDQQLRELEQAVINMGNFVIEMLEKAIEVLVWRDVELADEVMRMDDTADEMDLAIESACMKLLALQQPMSKDLRTIATALKIITDLERIGDYSEDIAKAAQILVRDLNCRWLVDTPLLGRLAIQMIREALQSFINRDVELARKVCRDDEAVDSLYHAIFNEVIAHVEKNPKFARQGAYLILIARRLERTADHATNIAERVYYMETGKLEQWAKLVKQVS